MKRLKLSKKEKGIEDALVAGKFINVDSERFKDIANIIKRRQKDTAINLRINSQDLKIIKQKAKKIGVKYQSFISEVLHQIAS
jgi:predicted DNA binding CopG/RHH family protein